MEAFAYNLSGKKVMLEDGREVGTIDNIMMKRTATGELSHFVVSRNNQKELPFKSNGNKIEIPVKCVNAVEDYIIVDPPRTN